MNRTRTTPATHTTRTTPATPATPRTRTVRRAAAVLLLPVALLLAACGSSSGGSGAAAPLVAATPSVAPGALLGTESTSLGTLLVDSQGKTVYVFAADSPGHSNCAGTCLAYWPPVMAPATLPSSQPGVTATLGQIVRADGGHQLTVNGWPVYTYAGDSGPGTTAGQGKNLSGGLWWVVTSAGGQVTAAAAASSPSPSAATSSKSSGGGGWA